MERLRADGRGDGGLVFFFSSRRRHTRCSRDWSSDVCSSDLEKVYAKILTGVEAGSPAKQKIFRWAVGVGRDVSRHQQQGQPVPAALEWKRKLAHKLVFSKLHAALGGRLQWAVSGGAPLSRDIAEFFHAAGILLLDGYGLTETCPALTFNQPTRFKFGSVGQALSGVELKIAPRSEER